MGKTPPEQPSGSPEDSPASPSSKKRKTALGEIEVDLSLPEPPSKKARRAMKKGKAMLAPKPSGDEKVGRDGSEGDKPDAARSKKKDRSPHGVWIGNLPFTATRTSLRQWLVDSSGGSITDDAITRVHMPVTKPAGGGEKRKGPAGEGGQSNNKGFAYVDFTTFAASVAAIALSETELGGRKLLIKDSRSFEGRPEKEKDAGDGNGDGADRGEGKNERGGADGAAKAASRKVFVGNLGFATDEDDLWAHFEKCGEIEWVKVATFEDTGKCKGFGWVKFKEPEAAAWAVKGFVKIKEEVLTEDDFVDGDKGEDGEKAEKPNTKRVKTRKWWVNTLKGRSLKIELAEDDQVRYKKRFGKDALQKGEKGGQPARPGKPTSSDQGSSTGKAPRGDGRIGSQADINVARLTGAAVPSQGTRTTFV